MQQESFISKEKNNQTGTTNGNLKKKKAQKQQQITYIAQQQIESAATKDNEKSLVDENKNEELPEAQRKLSIKELQSKFDKGKGVPKVDYQKQQKEAQKQQKVGVQKQEQKENAQQMENQFLQQKEKQQQQQQQINDEEIQKQEYAERFQSTKLQFEIKERNVRIAQFETLVGELKKQIDLKDLTIAKLEVQLQGTHDQIQKHETQLQSMQSLVKEKEHSLQVLTSSLQSALTEKQMKKDETGESQIQIEHYSRMNTVIRELQSENRTLRKKLSDTLHTMSEQQQIDRRQLQQARMSVSAAQSDKVALQQSQQQQYLQSMKKSSSNASSFIHVMAKPVTLNLNNTNLQAQMEDVKGKFALLKCAIIQHLTKYSNENTVQQKINQAIDEEDDDAHMSLQMKSMQQGEGALFILDSRSLLEKYAEAIGLLNQKELAGYDMTELTNLAQYSNSKHQPSQQYNVDVRKLFQQVKNVVIVMDAQLQMQLNDDLFQENAIFQSAGEFFYEFFPRHLCTNTGAVAVEQPPLQAEKQKEDQLALEP